jgi:hypothetical protein
MGHLPLTTKVRKLLFYFIYKKKKKNEGSELMLTKIVPLEMSKELI